MRLHFLPHSVTEQTKHGVEHPSFWQKGDRETATGPWGVTLPSETCDSVFWELHCGLSRAGRVPMGSLGQSLGSRCRLVISAVIQAAADLR